LIKETNAILETEKKKLEEKQHRTQEEIETLKQLNITYKLVDGGKDAWKDVPILLAASKQHSLKSVYSSVTNNGNETHELKNQTQLSKQDKNNFEIQAKQLESFKQEIPDFELQVKEKHKDNELVLLRNDTQSLKCGNTIIQHQPQTNDSEINPLQSEIQKLKLTVSSLKHQVREKDAKIESFQTDNLSLRHRIDGCEQQIKARDNKINLLESEKVAYHSTSMQQTQIIDSLKQEKQMVEQVKTSAINELEQLKASYTTLEQLLKAKEDTIASLNRENLMLSTVNQGNQQGPTDMVDTLKNLLQNMENLSANEKQRIDALEEDNRALKQERIQQQATIQNTGPLNDSNNSTNSNPIHSDQHDNSYNDLNYESEYSDTEENEVDDINYDTPSEDEDRNNDLNYDDLK
jgi:peptidoglycan hydrolase CwlO-like protein